MCFDLQVKRIVIHPKYDPATTNNDVALLKLKDKIDFGKFDGTVAPICIPQSLRAYTGQTVRALHILNLSRALDNYSTGYCGGLGSTWGG